MGVKKATALEIFLQSIKDIKFLHEYKKCGKKLHYHYHRAEFSNSNITETAIFRLDTQRFGYHFSLFFT